MLQAAGINYLPQIFFTECITIDQADITRQLLHLPGYLQIPLLVRNGNGKALIRPPVNTLPVPCKGRVLFRYHDVFDFAILPYAKQVKCFPLYFGNGIRNINHWGHRTAERIRCNLFYPVRDGIRFATCCRKKQSFVFFAD